MDHLSGAEFEDLVGTLLSQMGLQVERSTPGADGGIDIIATSNAAILGGRYIVQCKRYSGSVGEPVVRELFGVVQAAHASKGILITSGEFTKQARTFAEGLPLELIDGDALATLLAEHQCEANDDDPANHVYRPTANLQHLARALSKSLAPIWRDLTDLRGGFVARKPRAKDPFAYESWAANAQSELAECAVTLYTIINEGLSPLLVAGADPSPNDVAHYAKLFASSVRPILRLRKSTTDIVPPDLYSTAHGALLDAIDGVLENCKSLADRLHSLASGDLVPSADDDGNIRINVDLGGAAFQRMVAEYKALQEPDTTDGQGCFVVTAAAGNVRAPEALLLRRWRDSVLANTLAGQGAILLYALLGPVCARIVRRHRMCTHIARVVIRWACIRTTRSRARATWG